MRNMIFVIWIMMLIGFTGCKQEGWYVETVAVDNPWMYDDPIIFEFDVEGKDDSSHEMLLRLKHAQSYGYQNLYVKIKTTFPDKEIVEDVVSLDLTDGRGYAGTCSGGACEVDILLRSAFKFKQSGDYTLSIEQYGREEGLEGIISATLIVRDKVD